MASKPQKHVSQVALTKNTLDVNFIRSAAAAAGACIVGVLGLTGVRGFAAYLLFHAIASLAILSRMSWRPDLYLYQSSVPKLLLSGLGDNLLMYIFLWTLSYAFVHIY